MKGEGDPFEILREINPVDPDTLPDPSRSPDALAVVERILRGDIAATEERSWWSVRRAPRRRIYLVPVVAVVALVVGTLAWALTQGPTKQLSVGCYESASLDAKTAIVSPDDSPPVEACRAVWLSGVFGQPPPPLQACVLPSGAVGVFPSPDGNSCDLLNLAPASTAAETPTPPAVALQKALVDKFLRQRCVAESAARRIIQRELRRLHLEGWRVTASGRFDSARPCASLAFDEERKEVLLVPLPR
jgi:hypothetical protein